MQEYMPLFDEGDKGAAVVLGHELGHALILLRDPGKKPPQHPCGGNVTLVENALRASLGLDLRVTYAAYPVPPESVVVKMDRNRMKSFMAKYRLDLTPARTARITKYLEDKVDTLEASINNPQ